MYKVMHQNNQYQDQEKNLIN